MVCVGVGVGAGHVAGEDVAGVHGHEADVASVRVTVGERLDVGGEPEPVAAGERDGAAVPGDRDGVHTCLRAERPLFAPPRVVKFAQFAPGVRDQSAGGRVRGVLGCGDLVVAVADRLAQQEAARALRELVDEVEAVV